MKNIKRILLAFVAVFAAVLLVACGAKSDNGTYVYKPSKTELKKILEEQGLSGSQLESIGDVINFEVSIKIKDSKSKSSTSQSFIANDNGKYVYNADKEKIESILKEQGATDDELNQFSDQLTLTMTIEIKDTKAKMIIEMKSLEDSKENKIDLKADQKTKTLESAEGGMDKIKYKINGDVLTLELSKFESDDSETFALLKDAKFKRQE